jgi:hypothetical protein
MPLPTTGTVEYSTEDLPGSGEQVRFLVKDAEYRPAAKYGPDYFLRLSILTDRYAGVPASMWPRLSQPRLDLVRDLKSKGVSAKAIRETVQERAATNPADFGFDRKVDDPQEPRISHRGNVKKLIVAMCGGDHKKADEVLERLDSWEELGNFFVGKIFVAHTKAKTKVNDAGETRTYINVDGEMEIYADKEVVDAADAEDFEELPDVFGGGDAPEAPF